MRLTVSPELDSYRNEVREFIAANSPGQRPHSGVRAPEDHEMPAIRRWIGQLYEAGYLGQNWPVEYGGAQNPDQQKAFIVAEELAAARTWEQVGAAQLAAGALIEFGTKEQQDHFLPRIRNASDLWCQLFSEPGAGSDLAGLSTKARREGDHFVVDGQKVWTTNGQHADIGYLLARTDPGASKKQLGITAFAIDMNSPGVSVRPLREITGTSDFNEVFLDGVQVPADRVIGEVNAGWTVANSSLAHERSGVAARGAELFAELDDLLELARTTEVSGKAVIEDGSVAQRIGKVAVDMYTIDLMSKVVQSKMLTGNESPSDAPAVKIFYGETNLAAGELGVEIQGVSGIGVEGDAHALANGWWQDAYLYARALTIAGGANEVLRTVIAERTLGLPREPKWATK